MTRDEAAIERMAAARYEEFCREPPNECDETIPWADLDPEQRRFWLDEERASLAALLADPPPAVERAVLERLIAEQRRECARLRQDDPYFVPHIKARIDFLSDRLAELDAEEKRDAR